MSLITANWSKSLWTQVAFIPCWAIWVTSDILWRIPVFGSSGNDIWWQYHYSCIEWKLVSSCFLRIHSCRVDAFSRLLIQKTYLQATSKRPPSDLQATSKRRRYSQPWFLCGIIWSNDGQSFGQYAHMWNCTGSREHTKRNWPCSPPLNFGFSTWQWLIYFATLFAHIGQALGGCTNAVFEKCYLTWLPPAIITMRRVSIFICRTYKSSKQPIRKCTKYSGLAKISRSALLEKQSTSTLSCYSNVWLLSVMLT